jgi:hypothetical protein
MKSFGTIGKLVAAGVGILSVARPAHAFNDGTREFYAYGVEVFEQIGNACDGNDLDWTRDQAHNFYEVFDDWQDNGQWGVASYFEDTEVDGRDFTDPSTNPSCSDYQQTCSLTASDDAAGFGADSADVVFLSTHGSYSTTSDTLNWKMGEIANDCSVSTGTATAGNMLWDRDAEVLIIDACNSARKNVWSDSFDSWPYTGMVNMLTATGTMNTLLGYDGTAPDRVWGKSYAEDVYDDGIGQDWVVEGYNHGNMKDNQDTCAVAVLFGDDAGDREHMYEWGGFNDREDTGDPTLGSTYFFVEGCDPAGQDPQY